MKIEIKIETCERETEKNKWAKKKTHFLASPHASFIHAERDPELTSVFGASARGERHTGLHTARLETVSQSEAAFAHQRIFAQSAV